MLGHAPIAALPLAGSASAAEAAAAGAIVTATITLLAGTATGVRTDRLPSINLPHYFVAKPGRTSIDARAYGQTVVCTATLLPGRASAKSLVAGRATGSATARARSVWIKATLKAGSAAGERNWTEDELLILAMAA